MRTAYRAGRVNYRLLLILVGITLAICIGAGIAHSMRKRAIAREALALGQAAYARQQWAAAASYLRQYLERYPEDSEVLSRYAHSQVSVDPLDSAAIGNGLLAYRRLVRLQPDNREAYEQLARLYAGIRDFTNLAYIARMRLQKEPDDLQSAAWLAKALIALHRPDEAAQVLEPMVEKWSDRPERRAAYVDACAMLSDLRAQENTTDAMQAALAWLDRAVEYMPDSAEAHINRARFRRTFANWPGQDPQALLVGALSDLRRATDLQPQDPRLRLVLSEEWMRHGRLDEAAAQLEAVQDLPGDLIRQHFLDTNDWTISLFLQTAELALRRDDPQAAAALADGALAQLKDKGQRLPALPTAIRAYIAAERIDDARRHLREYLDMQATIPGSAELQDVAMLLKGLVARAEAKPYEIIQALEPAMAHLRDNPTAWRLLAEAYSLTNQPRRAIQAAMHYLQIQPHDLPIRQMVLRDCIRVQDWKAAVAQAAVIESIDPGNLDARLLRIEDAINRSLLLSADERAAALADLWDELQALSSDHPRSPDVWMLLAAVAANQGDMPRAREQLRQAMEHGAAPLAAALEEARILLNLHRPDEALAVYRQACEQFPAEPRPWVELASLQQARGEADEAVATMEAAIGHMKTPEDRHTICVRLARHQIARGDRAAGLQALQDLAAADPDDLFVRTLLLDQPEIQTDPQKAHPYIEDLRRIEGDSGLLWRLYQSAVWLAGDDWRSRRQAITEHLQRCVDADPAWIPPALLLGRLYERTADLAAAESLYRRVLNVDPTAIAIADRLLALLDRQHRMDEADTVLGGLQISESAMTTRRALVAMNAGDLSRAIEDLETRVSHDSQDVQSRLLLSQLVYRRDHDAAKALDYLDQAEAISPGSLGVVAARVVILTAEGRHDEARRLLDEQVEGTGSIEAYRLRATWLASAGELERAERDLRHVAQTSVDASGYDMLGGFYAQTQRLDEAIAAWRTGLDAHPNDPDLRRNLAKALILKGGEARAEADRLLAALENDLPGDPNLLTLRASLLLQQDDPAATRQAEQLLERAVQAVPTLVEAHLQLITIALRRNDYAAARDLVVRAQGANPNHQQLTLIRAQTELALGSYSLARDLALLVLQDDPASDMAATIVANAALATGTPADYRKAQDLLADLIARQPDNAEAQVLLARVRVATGQMDQARTDLMAFANSDAGRSSLDAMLALAELARLEGDAEKAREWVDRAAQTDADSPAVVRARIAWLGSEGQYEDIVQLVGEHPAARDNAEVLVAAASTLAGAGTAERSRQALELFEKALEVSPGLLPAQLGVAALSYQTGDIDRAERMYRHVLRNDPLNIQALNDLAWLLSEDRRQYGEALELASRAAELAPGNPHILDTRGTVLAHLPERLPDALDDLRRAAGLTPPDSAARARALLKVGRIHRQLGDAAQARQVIDEALRIDQKQNVFTPAERNEIEQLVAGARPGDHRAEAGAPATP